jgi:hypothetical protein
MVGGGAVGLLFRVGDDCVTVSLPKSDRVGIVGLNCGIDLGDIVVARNVRFNETERLLPDTTGSMRRCDDQECDYAVSR